MDKGNLEKQLVHLFSEVSAPPEGLVPGRLRVLDAVIEAQPQAGRIPGYQPAKARRRLRLPRALVLRPLIWAISIILALGALTVGAGHASADALPGGALYPVKLAVEDLKLSLAQDAVARTDLMVQFLQVRLEEMETLGIVRGQVIPPAALNRLTRQMDQVMLQLVESRPDEDLPALAYLPDVLDSQIGVLEMLRPRPGQDQVALVRALEQTQWMRQQMEAYQQDPNRFRNQFQLRYTGSSGQGGDDSGKTEVVTPVPPPADGSDPVDSGTASPESQPGFGPADPRRERVEEQHQLSNPEPFDDCPNCDPVPRRMRATERVETQTPLPSITPSAEPPGARTPSSAVPGLPSTFAYHPTSSVPIAVGATPTANVTADGPGPGPDYQPSPTQQRPTGATPTWPGATPTANNPPGSPG
jgi:hypothetical protein